jgi:hypothetical protein
VRLAQLAMLMKTRTNLFPEILSAVSVKRVRQFFIVNTSEYWKGHYQFDEPSELKEKNIGNSMIDSVIINVVVPMVFVYGDYKKQELYQYKALEWLDETPVEKNSIIDTFKKLNLKIESALYSQALLELKSQYCDEKYCLSCPIGQAIIANDYEN